MVTVKEHQLLWTKIQNFRLDEENAVVKFSDKLSSQQNWSPVFTKRAIEEYRRFVFLCCVSEKGASPSFVVDQVWHLHLTYTQSYWKDFCRETLGWELHHHPSAGGDNEDHKHEEWYKDTLTMYEIMFGISPPRDIWPGPVTAGQPVDATDPAVDKKTAWRIAIALSLPLLFILVFYHEIIPYRLKGPAFLEFYLLSGAVLIAAYIIRRRYLAHSVDEVVAANFPADASPFQVAKFLYGNHRAFQTALVDLMQRNLLDTGRDKWFTIKTTSYAPPQQELNPLVHSLVRETYGRRYTYENLMNDWYSETRFSHPAFGALDAFADREESFIRQFIFLIIFLAIGIIRMGQGFLNDRPVGYLLLEMGIGSIVFAMVARAHTRKGMVLKATERLYRNRLLSGQEYYSGIVPNFVVQGPAAIGGFAEGVLLAGLFESYAPVRSHYDVSVGCGSSGCGGDGGGCGGGCGGCGGD